MDSLSASPIRSQSLKRIADVLRDLQGPTGQIILGTDFNPFQYLLPQAKTVENLAYGNLPVGMPYSGTGGYIPVVKTNRGEELADLVATFGALPGAAKAVSSGANKIGDLLTRAVTRNPEATSLRALSEIDRMSPFPQITVYHGSPYLFKKFDPMKVGTGEGAQAYGVGAGYTAEARPVAEQYKTALADTKYFSNGKELKGNEAWAAQFLHDFENDALPKKIDADMAIQKATEVLKPGKTQEEVINKIRELEKSGVRVENGYLYKGDIPDEILPKFLDWDKPLSQQSQDVQEVLKRRIADVVPQDKFDMGGNARLRDNRQGQIDKSSPSPWLMETTGEDGTKYFGLSQKDVDRMFGSKDAKDLTGHQIYARLTQEKGSQQAASEYLDSIGVRGIRYLDAGSRAGKEGTSNFVPFRPEDFKIQEINDKPLQEWINKGLLP